MRKLLCGMLGILFLTGCAALNSVPKEYVRDVLPTCIAEDAPYEIEIAPPKDALEADCGEHYKVYEAPDGVYSVETRTFVTDSLDAAVFRIAGEAAPRVRVMLARGEGEECRFAWCSGQMVCRAKVVLIGDFCYALCFRLKEGLGHSYNDCINEVFSSFCLFEAPSDDSQVFSEDISE